MIIFPSNPFSKNQPDESFQLEYLSAKKHGLKVGFVDIELLFGGECRLRFPEGDDNFAIYRGWILKPEQHKLLETSLGSKCKLLNSNENYNFIYNLPNWHYFIPEKYRIPTVILPGSSDEIRNNIKDNGFQFYLNLPFENKPIIVKDYLKSRKHEWYDACYIYSASDETEIKRVVNNFLDGQGTDFVGGLVFREFINLKKIGIHSKSRMPLTNEHRYFMMGDNILAHYNYWSEGDYSETIRPILLIKKIAQSLNKPELFFTIDIAEKENGDLVVIELGDGGSSGIPENGDPDLLYKNLIPFL